MLDRVGVLVLDPVLEVGEPAGGPLAVGVVLRLGHLAGGLLQFVLELQQRRGGDIEPLVAADQPAHAGMPRIDPDQRAGVEENHRRRLPRNASAIGVQFHVHTPSATFPMITSAGYASKIAQKANFVPSGLQARFSSHA